MKVMLANLPWKKPGLYGIRAGSRWPFMMKPDRRIKNGRVIPGYMPFPFFMAYAAALLERSKKDVLLVDALAEGLYDGEFMEKFEKYSPDILLIETSTPSFGNDIKWAGVLKEKRPAVKIIMTGPHATYFGSEIIEKNSPVDYILCGEYETALLELVNAAESGKSPDGIPGIYYREGGTAVYTGERKLLEDINSLPWPARHFLPMYSYNDTFAGLPEPNVQLWASRGCPYNCVFCSWPQTMYGGTRYRVRDYRDVVDEIESVVKEYGFRAFYFDDDTFNIGRERMVNISTEIKKRGMNLPWAIMARADTTGADSLKVMKDAGLYAVKYGVESGSQEILNASGKKLALKAVEDAVFESKKLGIKVHLTFTFGLPGETEETIKKTVDYVKKLDPDSVQFSLVTPFPGTRYYDSLKEKGYILTDNWEEFDGGNRSVIRTDSLNEDRLSYWLDRAIREWNMHQLKTRILKRPFRSAWHAVTKPRYLAIFIRNLFRGLFRKKQI